MWAVEDVDGRTGSPSQLHLLETVASQPAGGLQLDPLVAAACRGGAPSAALEVYPARRPPWRRPRRPRSSRCRPLPAGSYRFRYCRRSRGWVMVGIARDPRDPFALQTAQLPVAPIELRFPVSVAAGHSRRRGRLADRSPAHRRTAGGPASRAAPDGRPGAERGALRRRRLYFLDDRGFPEPEAFWIGGSTGTRRRHSAGRAGGDSRRCSCETRRSRIASCFRPEAGARAADGARRGAARDMPVDAARGASLLRVSRPARDSVRRNASRPAAISGFSGLGQGRGSQVPQLQRFVPMF